MAIMQNVSFSFAMPATSTAAVAAVHWLCGEAVVVDAFIQIISVTNHNAKACRIVWVEVSHTLKLSTFLNAVFCCK